jgi:hypothetical protein
MRNCIGAQDRPQAGCRESRPKKKGEAREDFSLSKKEDYFFFFFTTFFFLGAAFFFFLTAIVTHPLWCARERESIFQTKDF